MGPYYGGVFFSFGVAAKFGRQTAGVGRQTAGVGRQTAGDLTSCTTEDRNDGIGHSHIYIYIYSSDTPWPYNSPVGSCDTPWWKPMTLLSGDRSEGYNNYFR